MTVELVNEVGVTLVSADASDEMVAMAAWVSNNMDDENRLSDKSRVKGLINFLYRNKHMSPFEHGRFTFKVDVPLFVAREFMRHRTASYNEVSGRYTVMEPRFYAATTVRVQQGKMGNYYFVDGSDDQTALYLQTKRSQVESAWNNYQARIDAGMAKEQAREELPLSLMTQFYVTMNPRNLMQFLALRNDKHALKEIRDVAVKMEEIFASHMPMTYEAYRSVRDNEAVDVEVLQSDLLNAQNKIAYLEREVGQYQTIISSLKNAKADIESKYNDLVSRYNTEFVASRQEAEMSNENDNLRASNTMVEDLVDQIVPRAAELLEMALPAYNKLIQSVSVMDEMNKRRKSGK